MIREIFRQRQRLIRDGRKPERIKMGERAFEDVVCETTYLSCLFVELPPGCLGYIAGLPIYPSDREEVTVLAADWQGFAQGSVRGKELSS